VTTASGVDLGRLAAFLYHEADLMDAHRYADWEALWDDDGVYWVPVKPVDYDPARHVSIIYEDRGGIRVRVERLISGLAYTQDPKSQLRRVVSNVRLVGESAGAVEVASNFVLLEYRQGRWTTWAGRSDHRLRPGGEAGFRIARKKVLLVGCDTDLPPLQFLI
jgi:benzoate/toluate 1,2-dioxygenase subunit beta